MHGFGYWKDFKNLMEQTDGLELGELVKDHDPSEGMLEDVVVPKLERGSDSFKKRNKDGKTQGSAGNSLKSQEGEAQMGCADAQTDGLGLGGGLGGGIKKEFTKMESFHAGEVVDDSSMDKAREVSALNQPEKITDEGDVFKKLDDMWKDIWGETYKDKLKKVQNKNYDFDATKLQPKYSVELSAGSPRTHITNPPMKRGW
jgi:hypothetical protein